MSEDPYSATKSGRLADRLRRMTESGVLDADSARKVTPPEVTPRRRQSPDRLPAEKTPPHGWKAMSENVWIRRSVLPSTCPPHLPPSPLIPKGGIIDDFIFFDIETTGLSGGAGTLAFLLGLGSTNGETLTVEQFFLLDYPGEPEFLDIVLSRMRPGKIFVSYNGKAFDTQILRSRCILNGRQLTVARQLDLLYCARRLYRETLPSCRLASLEEHVLGVQRESDIPGALIPDIYFDFLATGRISELERVFAHHLQDIASLERLLGHLARVLDDPSVDGYADRCRLGRWHVNSGFSKGFDLLQRAFEEGDSEAGYHLAMYLKRNGEIERAAEIWRVLYNGQADLRAAFELSKYAEHKVRDFDLAERLSLAIIETLGTSTAVKPPETLEALQYRLQRIRRKKTGVQSSAELST